MEGSNQSNRTAYRGGEGTGRYDRGEIVAASGLLLKDPVHRGRIETHDLYGPATPNVGSAWALPRNHPLYAPMDFEVKELDAVEKKEFEPINRPQLSPEQIAEVRRKNLEYFGKKPETTTERVEYVEAPRFQGRKPGFYWGRGDEGLGYHIDYKQMRHLMALDVGDRCEARYRRVRRYFNGVVVKARDVNCTYDVRFEHGHLEEGIPAEHVRRKDWKGVIKESDGMVRALRAANPLLETKDKSVQWYEQLLMYEQGRIDAPQPPEGLFSSSSSSSEKPPPPPGNKKKTTNALEFLDTEGTTEEKAEPPAAETSSAIKPETSEAGTPQEEEAGGSSWRAYALPERSNRDDDDGRIAIAKVEDVVASGDAWKPESHGYKKFWDPEGFPHRSGPPVHLPWYGSDLEEEETAGDLCGDDTVKKLIERQGSGRRPVAGASATCHLVGRRLDGTIFLTTYDAEPIKYKLFCDEDEKGVPRARRYVQGVHEAIASMRPGEVARFTLSPEKGYGRKGKFPAIPGYSKEAPRGTWLEYEIELIEVKCAEETTIVDPRTFGLLERPKGYEWRDAAPTVEEGEEEKRCAWCGKPERCLLRGQRFQRCGRCKATTYCSAACAKAAWPSHKVVCTGGEDHLVLAEPESRLVACVRERLGGGRARPRVCVVAAYRNQLPLQDRQGQLFKFVPYMAAFLGSAWPPCDFTVVIATQTDDGRKFNRGRLMNAAFRDVVRDGEYDAVVFHDVDILPSEELMPYYAVPPTPGKPAHLAGVWRSKFDDPHFVGGAISFVPSDFVECNGYPNDCWGWGLDDEELALRMREAGLRVVRPRVGTYSDLDPINLRNVVRSDERGYYHEWWNMDMENGKCRPKIAGPIDWATYRKWWRTRGLADIEGHSELVARTTEFGGRVVRLLYALENDLERKEGTVALVSARMGLRATIEHGHLMHGPVVDNAMKQTQAYAKQGNLKRDEPRLMYENKNLLTPQEHFKLQGGRRPRRLAAASSSSSSGQQQGGGRRRLTNGGSAS
ncbi:hypothetical protein CTAYLR_010103 [Chrysophaeum taylorii]|uniref:peptidylprolyl isomerase n=1 Tax=Chrysophaeum taylorii TaxID=2483200 RepID=A0AAD7U5L3_9STRA|nr:hypothetical protein CTAYLR_010103 [Chrysophaeum taylorii]